MTSQLSHSPADVLAQLIVQLGLGGDPEDDPLPDWPVYPTKEPNLPDRVIAVFDTMGVSFGYSSNTGNQYYKAGFQLSVRAEYPNVSYAKTEAVASYLNKNPAAKLVEVSLGSSSYCVEVVTCGITIPMPRTDTPTSKRAKHVVNGYITLTEL